MLTIGIDPGLSGAVSVLNATGEVELLEGLPIQRDGKLAWIDPLALRGLIVGIQHGRPAHAVIERVWALPKQSTQSGFTFGVGFGSLLATVQTLGIGVELVPPSKWKGDLGLTSDKNASLNRARLIFPNADLGRRKDAGRAEALLLAWWHLRRGNKA